MFVSPTLRPQHIIQVLQYLYILYSPSLPVQNKTHKRAKIIKSQIQRLTQQQIPVACAVHLAPLLIFPSAPILAHCLPAGIELTGTYDDTVSQLLSQQCGVCVNASAGESQVPIHADGECDREQHEAKRKDHGLLRIGHVVPGQVQGPQLANYTAHAAAAAASAHRHSLSI